MLGPGISSFSGWQCSSLCVCASDGLSEIRGISFLNQVYNKIDQISMEEVDRLARRPHSVVIRYELAGVLSCPFEELCSIVINR